MSLCPQPIGPVPEETARAARAAFPKGNPYLRMRDEFETFFADEQFVSLFAHRGRPAEAPWRLALVTLLQFAEDLSDQQAADAVRRCLDWKYLLGLDLADAGFDASVLSEFRARLVDGCQELLLLETLLTLFRQHGLLRARGKQRTDATHVVAAARLLNRLESVGETVRHTLNVLATVVPAWLLPHTAPEWGERYERRFEEQRLPSSPAQRQALAEQIGVDGFVLLTALYATETPAWLREVPAVQTLRRVWLQQYQREAAGARLGVRWRAEADLPPMPQRILSPYDPDARYGKKRSTVWGGYKVHFTETCEAEGPVLITDVQTTPPLTADSAVLPAIHQGLAARALLPQTHWVDGGYVDGATLVSSREQHQIDLLGPAPADTGWQAQAGEGFAASDFQVDWEGQSAVCPQGQRSVSWHEKPQRGQPVITVTFSAPVCRACPSREPCTRSATARRRLTLRPEAEYRALAAARERQRQPEFAQSYGHRAGIEGTHTQGVRRCGLRHCRYVGEAKVHLQHVVTAAALDFLRVAAWLMGTPRSRTRESAFVRMLALA
jgi:transposase